MEREAATWNAPAAHAEKDAAHKAHLAHLERQGDRDGLRSYAAVCAAQGRCDGEKARRLAQQSLALARLKRAKRVRGATVRRRKRVGEKKAKDPRCVGTPEVQAVISGLFAEEPIPG